MTNKKINILCPPHTHAKTKRQCTHTSKRQSIRFFYAAYLISKRITQMLYCTALEAKFGRYMGPIKKPWLIPLLLLRRLPLMCCISPFVRENPMYQPAMLYWTAPQFSAHTYITPWIPLDEGDVLSLRGIYSKRECHYSHFWIPNLQFKNTSEPIDRNGNTSDFMVLYVKSYHAIFSWLL